MFHLWVANLSLIFSPVRPEQLFCLPADRDIRRVANLFCCLCLHRRVRAALCVVYARFANENWRNTMAFDLVFGLVSAACFDGKSDRQRESSAHPFENRKRMRHPLLSYRKQENQEAVKAAPPVVGLPHQGWPVLARCSRGRGERMCATPPFDLAFL